MKWSEFVELVNSQIAEQGLGDPEIDDIDVMCAKDAEVVDNLDGTITIHD